MIYVGTCSWAEKTLIKSRGFYPRSAGTAEARLKYYSAIFDAVEIDSSYYAIPDKKNTSAWAQRTPDNFIFHAKVYGALTRHAIDPMTLPAEIRDMLNREDVGERRLYVREPLLLEAIAQSFREALSPLEMSGKLGILVFQFPPWFEYSAENICYMLKCRQMFSDLDIAVEFRHGSWLTPDKKESVLQMLKDNRITYVAADEPQFGDLSTVPFLPAFTTGTAYFRFHGRNKQNWAKKNLETSLRYAYLYSDVELMEFVPAIRSAAGKAKDVHVMYNNCYDTYAVDNARTTKELLGIKSKDRRPVSGNPQLA